MFQGVTNRGMILLNATLLPRRYTIHKTQRCSLILFSHNLYRVMCSAFCCALKVTRKCTDCCNLLTPGRGALQDTLAYQCRGWWRSSGTHQSEPHWSATRHFPSWASISSWKASLKPDCGSSQYLPDRVRNKGGRGEEMEKVDGRIRILVRSLAVARLLTSAAKCNEALEHTIVS